MSTTNIKQQYEYCCDLSDEYLVKAGSFNLVLERLKAASPSIGLYPERNAFLEANQGTIYPVLKHLAAELFVSDTPMYVKLAIGMLMALHPRTTTKSIAAIAGVKYGVVHSIRVSLENAGKLRKYRQHVCRHPRGAAMKLLSQELRRDPRRLNHAIALLVNVDPSSVSAERRRLEQEEGLEVYPPAHADSGVKGPRVRKRQSPMVLVSATAESAAAVEPATDTPVPEVVDETPVTPATPVVPDEPEVRVAASKPRVKEPEVPSIPAAEMSKPEAPRCETCLRCESYKRQVEFYRAELERVTAIVK